MKTKLPRLVTERLVLCAFDLADAPTVERLAGAREVADATLNVPHPYPPGAAVEWISTHPADWEQGERLTLAIRLRESPEDLIGATSLSISATHRHGELGYWIGATFWGMGYATEAARVFIAYAFTELGLHRIQARHFQRNPASGRVMQKLGMQLEGVHRDAYLRWGRFEDTALYGVLAPEWGADGSTPPTQSEVDG